MGHATEGRADEFLEMSNRLSTWKQIIYVGVYATLHEMFSLLFQAVRPTCLLKANWQAKKCVNIKTD